MNQSIEFAFDPWRGGFQFRFAPFTWDNRIRVFGRLAAAMPDGEGRLLAFMSFWDRGGLPIRNIHQKIPWSIDEHYPVASPVTRSPYFQFEQNPESVAIWFGREESFPLSDWTAQTDAQFQITLYFCPEQARSGPAVCPEGGSFYNLVGGIQLSLAKTVIEYPVSVLRFCCEDLK